MAKKRDWWSGSGGTASAYQVWDPEFKPHAVHDVSPEDLMSIHWIFFLLMGKEKVVERKLGKKWATFKDEEHIFILEELMGTEQNKVKKINPHKMSYFNEKSFCVSKENLSMRRWLHDTACRKYILSNAEGKWLWTQNFIFSQITNQVWGQISQGSKYTCYTLFLKICSEA
jgi:hypothetical protein